MYINPPNNVDKLDTGFTHNILKKIISRLLNNLLPTDPQREKQGGVHTCLVLVHCLYNGERKRI